MRGLVDGVLAAWSGLRLGAPLSGGHGSDVWRGSRAGEPVVVRLSRRAPASLAWELELLHSLVDAGVGVPEPLPTDSGHWTAPGVVVQRWVPGREPSTDGDWAAVAALLHRVHELGRGHPQRPGCVTLAELPAAGRSVDADMGRLPVDVATELSGVLSRAEGLPTSVVHGDPGPQNVRIDEEGRVWLLDWDESRVDATALDLAAVPADTPGAVIDERVALLVDAWEVANAWTVEPTYARRRLAALRARLA